MRPYEDMTDEEIVLAYQDGDFDAIDYICSKYRNLVSEYANFYFIKGGEKQDVIQEGMVGLFKAIQDYNLDKGIPFEAFARLCIKRQILNAIEAADRLKNQPLNSYISFSDEGEEGSGQKIMESLLTDDIFNPENMMVDKEKAFAISEQIISVLSKMEMQVFLYMLQDLDYRTIAEKMGKNEKNIDNTIQRIRQKVRKLNV